MSFDHGLKEGNVITNGELRSIFKCGPQGGMRRSLATNTLVIVSDHTRGIYDDHWAGDMLYYTGMGMKGDQDLDATQNKTLKKRGIDGLEEIRVIGHACSLGAPRAYNKHLSFRRAGAVTTYLKECFSVDSRVLTVIGEGEDVPLLAGVDKDARTLNRRVEIRHNY